MVSNRSELLIDDVYRRLRDLILSNVLRAGQKLVDRELAEHLGVGFNVIEYRLLRAKKRLRSQLQQAGGRETAV